MDAHVTINGERFRLGEGLEGLRLTTEYGFVAAQLAADVSLTALVDRVPDLFERDPSLRMPFDGTIVFEDGATEEFAGYIDDNTGTQELFATAPAALTVSGRSLIARLTDEPPGDKNRLTVAYSDAKWSQVIADVVKRRGFRTDGIQGTKEFAGQERASGGWFYSVDDKVPGEIINQAVGATGWIANARADNVFYFVPPESLQTAPEEFEYRPEDPDSTLQRYAVSLGRINQVRTRMIFKHTPPGSSIRCLIHDSRFGESMRLSGLYVPSRVVYTIERQDNDFVFYSDLDVAREAPNLGKEEKS